MIDSLGFSLRAQYLSLEIGSLQRCLAREHVEMSIVLSHIFRGLVLATAEVEP